LPLWLANEGADHVPYFRAGLGIEIGPLMAALIDLYFEDDIGFSHHLDFTMSPDAEGMRIPSLTPADVIPFAHTDAGDRFAFLASADPRATTDARPVCRVSRGVTSTRIVAADLAGFLSLLAIAGSTPIARDAMDVAYYQAREDLLCDPDHGRDARAVLDLLAALPGVAVPARPSTLAHAHPDRAFPLEG
jgi:hypothetical protein